MAPPETMLRLVADPTRWRLLTELAASDRRVGELVHLVDRPQNLVSYHLRELRDAGLVSSRRSSFDRRDTYYRVDVAHCADVFRAAGLALDPSLRVESEAPAPLPSSLRRPRVLFLCTGNSARSQMAEALVAHMSNQTVDARSAGSHPKALHPNAVRVMAARGIDLSSYAPKHLRRFARTRFARVVTLCDKVREVCPEFPGAPVTVHWSIPDPALAGASDHDSSDAFEAVAVDLESRIARLLARLARPQGEPVYGK